MKTILPTISTSFIVISAVCVALGWYFIARKKQQAHIKSMILAAVFATISFITYVSRMVFIGSTSFGGPESIRTAYQIFLIFHIILAMVGAVMGIQSLYSGYKKKLTKHRKIGPWTSVIWFVTAITGVAVYLLLYVIYEPGPTKIVFKVIIGQ